MDLLPREPGRTLAKPDPGRKRGGSRSQASSLRRPVQARAPDVGADRSAETEMGRSVK